MTELLQKTISEPPEKNQSNRLVIYQPPEEHEKKHRAKIGHDLYRFPFIYIYTVDLSIFYFFAGPRSVMLKVFPWLRWAKALSPLSGSLLVVTDFYLHLFQAMDPESELLGQPHPKKTHGKIMDHLNFKPPKMAILKGNIIFQHHFVGVPCWFLRCVKWTWCIIMVFTLQMHAFLERFIIFGPTQEGVDPILFLVKPLETASFISFLVVHHHILPAINSM